MQCSGMISRRMYLWEMSALPDRIRGQACKMQACPRGTWRKEVGVEKFTPANNCDILFINKMF